VDLALPGANGLQFCQRLRQEGTGLILVLTTPRHAEEVVVEALEQGADAYVGKPVSMREVQARITALGRRAQPGTASSGSQVKLGPTTVNLARQEVRRQGCLYRLTPTEGRLLHMFVAHAGQVLPASIICQWIWGMEDPDPNLLKTHIHHLRQKLEPDPARPRFLLTRPTAGYVLQLQEPARHSSGSAAPERL
jgi:DNA-binding response OmpR family regulator